MAITRNEQAEYTHWRPEEVKIIDDKPVRFSDVCVQKISVGDVEDPDIMVGGKIWEWQQSEEGQYIMEHAVKPPYWTRHVDHNTWGHQYRVVARLSEQDQIFWRLKWGGSNK